MQEYISSPIANNQNDPSFLKTILRVGLIAGVLDITAAMVTYMVMAPGKNPMLILNYISSAVFGKEIAYSGGWPMQLLGLFFHFLIAFIWAILFYFLYPSFKKIIKNKWVLGILYGILVWVIMNKIVVPLSNTPKNPFKLKSAIIGVVTLIICIGIPISLITEHYYKQIRNGNVR